MSHTKLGYLAILAFMGACFAAWSPPLTSGRSNAILCYNDEYSYSIPMDTPLLQQDAERAEQKAQELMRLTKQVKRNSNANAATAREISEAVKCHKRTGGDRTAARHQLRDG